MDGKGTSSAAVAAAGVIEDVPIVETPKAGATAHSRRRIAANFLAVSLTSALGVLLAILITAYSRRALGPVAIGQVNWNAAVLTYLALLASPGLQIIGQRDIARDPAHTAALTSLILSLQVLLALVAYGAVAAIALLNPRDGQTSLLLLLQGIGIIVSAGSVAWVLQAHERMVGPAIASSVVNLLQIPILMALIHGPDDVFIFVLYTAPFSLALIVFNFWYLQHHGLLRVRELRPRLAGTRRLLEESWPLAVSMGAALLIYNSGAIILGFSHSDAEVGLYTTAYKLMFMSTIVSGALFSAYFPVLSRAAKDPSDAARTASEFATLLAWIGLPIAALGWACGRHVNDLMFGAQYAQSGPYFEWLCLNVGLVFVNIGLGTPMLTWGYQKLHVMITGSVALSGLALNMFVVPAYGGWGAIATTLAAEFTVLVMLMMARRRMSIGRHPILPIIGPPLLCSTAVALGIAVLPDSLARFWWLEVGLGAAVLAGCIFVFERRIVTAALGLLKRPA